MDAAVRLRRRNNDPLDPGALDDMGRALMRSMSDDDLLRLVADAADDLRRAEQLLAAGDRHGIAIIERLRSRFGRLAPELHDRMDS